MAHDLIIKGGALITASDTFVADIAVDKGCVSMVGKLPQDGSKTIDARGKVVIPGGIDVHTHFDMPFMGATTIDDFASGSLGALFGGTTSFIDFAIQGRGRTFRQALDTWHKKADGKTNVDYGFHMIISELSDDRLKELDELIGEGVTSFKLFMAYPGIFMMDDAHIFKALLRSKENGGLVCMHAENGPVIDIIAQKNLAAGKTAPKYHALSRPLSMEAEATRRAIMLAELAGTPIYIVHMTAGDSVDEVRQARLRGVSAWGETCPQYLYLSHADYERPGFEGAKFVMSPPLRSKDNQPRLWKALNDNSLQAVSTDHCSFNMADSKASPGKVLGKKSFAKIPNGAPGVETRMLLMWDAVQKGLISPNRFVDVVSTTPAKLFGLYPRKGHLSPGADADIVIIDPKKTHTITAKKHHMRVDYNPYEGRKIAGSIQEVFLRGRHLVSGDKLLKKSQGRFLKRSPRNYN